MDLESKGKHILCGTGMMSAWPEWTGGRRVRKIDLKRDRQQYITRWFQNCRQAMITIIWGANRGFVCFGSSTEDYLVIDPKHTWCQHLQFIAGGKLVLFIDECISLKNSSWQVWSYDLLGFDRISIDVIVRNILTFFFSNTGICFVCIIDLTERKVSLSFCLVLVFSSLINSSHAYFVNVVKCK